MKNVDIYSEDINLPYQDITVDTLRTISRGTIDCLSLDDVSVTVIVTSNEYIRAINKDYRSKDTATDVISFAYRENPFPGIEESVENLGDVYLSLEKAAEQSLEYEITLYDEIKRLLIHGLLHLVGYDHETGEEDAAHMREREEDIFSKI
ncbi:MAG: rRNA maturation RNase YbeY [bacterium]|nr:rRNA maturation RNase YbeY [bacterium]